jgi:hypothetical protein
MTHIDCTHCSKTLNCIYMILKSDPDAKLNVRFSMKNGNGDWFGCFTEFV